MRGILSVYFALGYNANQNRETVVMKALQVRRAELDDVPAITALALDVFGQEEGFLSDIFNGWLKDDIDLCFKTRIAAAYASKEKDHYVVCLVDDIPNGPYLGIRGFVEVSLQPPTGDRPPQIPLALPLKIKLHSGNLSPYISNLVVDPKFRRRGFAQLLVKKCEELAIVWGYSSIYLHVDAEEPAATSLYAKLGYSVLKEDPLWAKFFKGIVLRFMRKDLRTQRERT